MSRIVAIIFFAFLLIILQMSFFPILLFSGSAPNLLLVAIIFFAVSFGIEKIWGVIIVLGLIMDLFFFFPMGVNTLSFFLVAILASFFAKKFLVFRGNWKFLLLASLVVFGTILNDFIIFLIADIFLNSDGIKNAASYFNQETFEKIAYNSAALGCLYFPLKKAGNYFFSRVSR